MSNTKRKQEVETESGRARQKRRDIEVTTIERTIHAVNTVKAVATTLATAQMTRLGIDSPLSLMACDPHLLRWFAGEFLSEPIRGKIMMCGGIDLAPKADVSVFDTEMRGWVPHGEMPWPKMKHGAVNASGCVFTVGGSNVWRPLESIHMFDPRTDKWTIMPAMAEARDEHGTCVVDGKIYVVGGYTTNGITSTCERFDPTTRRWDRLPPMIHRRATPYTIAVGDTLVVMGGMFEDRADWSHVPSPIEVLDTKSGTWKSMTTIYDIPDFAASAAVGDRFLWLFGGNNSNGNTTKISVYDAILGTWRESSTKMPHPLVSATAVVVRSSAYIIGGGASRGGPFERPKSMRIFNLDTERWCGTYPTSAKWRCATVAF